MIATHDFQKKVVHRICRYRIRSKVALDTWVHEIKRQAIIPIKIWEGRSKVALDTWAHEIKGQAIISIKMWEGKAKVCLMLFTFIQNVGLQLMKLISVDPSPPDLLIIEMNQKEIEMKITQCLKDSKLRWIYTGVYLT